MSSVFSKRASRCMTNEHLRPSLDDRASMQVFFQVGEVFARGLILEFVVHITKMEKMPALSNDGGVRGVVAGECYGDCEHDGQAVERRSDGGHFASSACVVDTSCM